MNILAIRLQMYNIFQNYVHFIQNLFKHHNIFFHEAKKVMCLPPSPLCVANKLQSNWLVYNINFGLYTTFDLAWWHVCVFKPNRFLYSSQIESCNQAKSKVVIKPNWKLYSSQIVWRLRATHFRDDGTQKEVAPRKGCH